MSQQFSEQVKYTFHDVSAYFSEEEWKLLHHWQKELYGNVMKEIHQALISLGPLIATTVFSLRAKEEQELVPMDNQDSETRHRIPNSPSEVITNPDVVFRINREETLCLKNSQDTEGREENDCISTGFPFLNTDICLRKEEPLSIFIDHLGMEVTEHSTSPIAGHEVVSFHVKDEEEPYCMDTQDSRRVESTSSPAGNGRISRKNKGDALKCTKTPPPSKVLSGKAKVSVLQNAEKRINSRSQPRSEVSQYLEEEKTTPCKSGFRNPTYSGLHKGIGKMETVDKCNASVNNQRNAKHLTYQRNTKLKWAWYKCTECDKGFRQNIDLIRHIRTHTGERPYQCTKCEKRFSRSSNLFRHQRTHTGERPYQCTTCEQSFSQKGHLILHQKTHMGKRETSPKLTGRETVNWTTEG